MPAIADAQKPIHRGHGPLLRGCVQPLAASSSASFWPSMKSSVPS